MELTQYWDRHRDKGGGGGLLLKDEEMSSDCELLSQVVQTNVYQSCQQSYLLHKVMFTISVLYSKDSQQNLRSLINFKEYHGPASMIHLIYLPFLI